MTISNLRVRLRRNWKYWPIIAAEKLHLAICALFMREDRLNDITIRWIGRAIIYGHTFEIEPEELK